MLDAKVVSVIHKMTGIHPYWHKILFLGLELCVHNAATTFVLMKCNWPLSF